MKTVLFDLDETLIDRSASLSNFALWQASGMLRREVTDPDLFCSRFVDLDANGGVLKNEVYSKLIDEFGIGDWSESELTKCYDLCFSGFCEPKRGVVGAVSELKSLGFKLGVVSNGRTPFQERNFYALGISAHFDAIVVSEAVGFRKPGREIFDIALEETGAKAEETVFVGDNPVADIDGANACGMYTVYVPGHYGETYEAANAICTSYDNLTALVLDAT
ncbi:MAG: HAD family hydrolase [Halioglobus sp.]|nr:HAD family hydrolase [Halioglobus sp.]